MLQVATFVLPQDQDKANEFLKTHKPEGSVSFNRDMIVVFWEDGTDPVEYQIAGLREYLKAVKEARIQQELAVYLLKAELADLNATHNANRFQEVSTGIRNAEDAIANQALKADFLNAKIAALQNANG